MIDPYDGCQFNCPYCFQTNDESWNKDIYVHTNIADLLKNRLNTWTKTETIYLGSKCDPYMPLEEEYCLTQKCLSELNELQINTMIATKSDNNLIFRDIDLLKNFKAEITVLMGISNINQVEKGLENKNILNANRLFENGVTVWVFIAPVLPHIMNTDDIISTLHQDIPVFLDKLRITSGGMQKRTMDYINNQFPQYHMEYEKIVYDNDETYFMKMVEKYKDNKRLTFLF